MKKVITIMFAFLLILMLVPLSASAETVEERTFQKEDIVRQILINEKPVYLPDRSGKTVKESASAQANGKYPTQKGVILYTKNTTNKIATVVGHAAIVYTPEKIVEATASGVKEGANNWNTSKTHCRAGMVPVLSNSAMNKVADKCYSWKGKPYNWDFAYTSTRAKFYCSQLVWAGYKDSASINLNSGNVIVFPSELISDSKVQVIYKKG
ncbi:MAG: YiiX/YebB-like N1pC/P60 family cysteine hydrolase [Anaerovoracaceae bacterium]